MRKIPWPTSAKQADSENTNDPKHTGVARQRNASTANDGPLQNEYLGACQNYGPFLGPYYNTGPNTEPNLGDPKRDHNSDNPPFEPFAEAQRCWCHHRGTAAFAGARWNLL